MSKSKDKEDSFIERLDRLEESTKQRERTGLEELLVDDGGDEGDELPPLPAGAGASDGDDTVFLSGFEEKVDGDPEHFAEEVSKGLSSDDPVRMY